MHRRMSIRLFGFGLAATMGWALAACGGASDSETPNAPSNGTHPLVGKEGPDFAAKTVTGGSKQLSMHALSGKVAVVDFWATWCEPCKKSFPKLEALRSKYGPDGVQIVGISEDDERSGIPEFTSNLGAKFPVIWDENKTIASKWQPKSMPSTFILDRNGVVRYVHLGYHDNEEAVIEREIKSLL